MELALAAKLTGEESPLKPCPRCGGWLITIRSGFDPDWFDPQYRIEDGTKFGKLDQAKFNARLKELGGNFEKYGWSKPVAPFHAACKSEEFWCHTRDFQTVEETIAAWNRREVFEGYEGVGKIFGPIPKEAMSVNTNPRKIEVFCHEEKRDWWQPVHAEMVSSGDTIRMFEPDGTPVLNQHGLTEWMVQKQPEILIGYLEPWAVDCGFPVFPMGFGRK